MQRYVKIGIGIVVVVAVGYLAYSQWQNGKQEGLTEDTQTSEVASSTPNYTIEVDRSTDIAAIQPSLSRGIQFAPSIPEEVRTSLRTQYEGLVSRLAGDPLRADDWFTLGVVYHTAGDYQGAREVWEFLLKVIPADAVALDNLGKLYHYNLKDYPKSESYFKQSIALNPTSLTPYLELHQLYRYSYKTETTKAADILKQAIAQFPETIELNLTLGAYYRDIGNYVAARAAFEAGLQKARNAGNVSLISQFGDELLRLETMAGDAQ